MKLSWNSVSSSTPSLGRRPHKVFKSAPGSETREVTPGLNVDLDGAGNVVGFDIDSASRRLDLSTLETVALPTKRTKAA